jgi:radical SAM superfamily enzyme YgiQ (UPF0313 family)
LKILLIQLPVPQHSLWKQWSNIPLAAGYLKAMCHKIGLLEKVDIEILNERDSNLAGDAKLIDIILSKSPDILGFSLYSWNSIRSLFIAKKIKRKLPNTRIIIGGPEVTIESKYLLNNSVIDIGCIGEGEFTFAEIISHILEKKNDFVNINGIFFRENGKIIITPPRPIVETLDVIPSPYILGIIDPKDYDMIWIEVKRGCHYRCTYCGDNLRPLRFFSLDRIQKEIQLSISKGIHTIKLLDPSFLTTPNFRKICKIIKNFNAAKNLSLFVELRAENLTKKVADLLKNCGINFIEVGLQSCNPIVLKNINRPTNLKKFIGGISILRKKKFGFSIDLIIGLPGESLKSFRETVRFLKSNQLISDVGVFPLEILPGTRLEKEKDKYGIKYRKKPPRLVIKTNSLSESDIEKCYEILNKSRHEKRDIRSGPYPLRVPMTSHLGINHLFQKDPAKKQLASIDIGQLNYPITKIIVELDADKQSPKDLDSLGRRLKTKVGSPLTVWFLSQNVELDFKLIRSFLKCISMSNPYLAWDVFLETQNAFNLSIIDEVKKSITSESSFLNNPIGIFAIFPLKNNGLANKWLNELNKIVTYLWYVEFSEEDNWKEELEQILKEKHKLFIADFHSGATIDFIVRVLKFIRNKRKDEHFLFKNIAINHLQKKDDDFIKRGVPVPRKLHECILRFDKELQLSSYVLPNAESREDILIWKYAVLKKANYLTSKQKK